MTLNNLLAKLQKLKDEGHGELPVIARHGDSGSCFTLGTPRVTSEKDDMGPFYVDGEYISIYAGH